jgi:hypothetical protein
VYPVFYSSGPFNLLETRPSEIAMRLYPNSTVVFVVAMLTLSISSWSTTLCLSFQPAAGTRSRLSVLAAVSPTKNDNTSAKSESFNQFSRRRVFDQVMVSTVATTMAGFLTATSLTPPPQPAHAVGPTKINLLNPTYTAVPCPKDKPIPGEKAMKGMRGLCVTVNVDLENAPEKELEKVGVYGFVTDQGTGESVLANNPDLSTDAGQFAMIESVKPTDKNIQFEFIAAVPSDMVGKRWKRGNDLGGGQID